MISPQTIKTARGVQKMFGSNYYAATLLLPKKIRYAVFIFYAFVRLADELVDNPKVGTSAAESLAAFIHEWRQAYTSGHSTNDLFLAWQEIMQLHAIESELVEDFLSAMKQDLTVTRFESYADLKSYMYGSAEVIGIILTKLFDCDNPSALAPARALGEAMQLTNFIRDINEDKKIRDRIYIPQEDLRRFNVTETALTDTPCTKAVRELLAYECARAHDLFKTAKPGIALLPKAVRPAVRTAAALYEEILYELERRGGCVQAEKIRFSPLKKLKIAVQYGYIKRK